ncbi:hypothetical protein B0H13DRAFT_1856009 [Mycena leptocephala]|nr:hypothetical protein B0H13DRAFT_1856009 [Mycena leptocephala]
MSKATDLCVKEASRLTDTARNGNFLKRPNNFASQPLQSRFNVCALLKAIIGKKTTDSEGDLVQRRQRNPDMIIIKGRTMITSMLLNLRSRETNLHLAMNSLLPWDSRVSDALQPVGKFYLQFPLGSEARELLWYCRLNVVPKIPVTANRKMLAESLSGTRAMDFDDVAQLVPNSLAPKSA